MISLTDHSAYQCLEDYQEEMQYALMELRAQHEGVVEHTKHLEQEIEEIEKKVKKVQKVMDMYVVMESGDSINQE